MMYENMEQVIKDSIRIENGMMAVFSGGEKWPIRVQDTVSKFPGAYCTNNSTICYCYKNQMFVMPYIRRAFDVIRRELSQDHFYVPFSNGDYPDGMLSRWRALREKAKVSYEEDFIEDCQTYSKKIGLKQLPEEVLAKCYKIPKEGVVVKRFNYVEITSPAINSRSFDCIAADRIGKFCTNNGRVVFVNNDGSTYVAKGYRVTEILKEHGFSESGLFVPFSNCEVIEDPSEQAVWDSKPKF